MGVYVTRQLRGPGAECDVVITRLQGCALRCQLTLSKGIAYSAVRLHCMVDGGWPLLLRAMCRSLCIVSNHRGNG